MTSGISDHLNLDAIVAFADGEMPMVAYQRAAAHVSRCPECDAEVNQQIMARSWLRAADTPAMPTGLLDSLRSIPVAVPAARPVDGVLVDPLSGRAIRSDEQARTSHNRWRFRFLGAGALVAGLAVGALALGAEQPDADTAVPNGQQVAQHSGQATPTVAPAILTRPSR
jgi:anti-sigma factor RsiW